MIGTLNLKNNKGGEYMNFNDYQNLSKRTMPDLNSPMTKANYALGLTGEAGEVGDLIKKEVFHGHPPDRVKVMGETGDVLHYQAGIATLYGFTLEEAATMNIEKLRKRYPEGFSEEASIERVDTKEEIITLPYIHMAVVIGQIAERENFTSIEDLLEYLEEHDTAQEQVTIF